jgi:hypothetical protein
MTGDDAVAEDLLVLHAEVGATMRHELVELDEAAVIEQRFDPFARGQLTGLVLLRDAGLTTGDGGLGLHLFEAGDRVWFHAAYPRVMA